MEAAYVIKKPVLTEKSTVDMEVGRYSFEVDRRATKTQIKEAVEQLYGVKVTGVQTLLTKQREKRTRFGYVRQAPTKKAIVRLREGDVIELF
ncbi:MAG: 50S ribosomal protein L23 [Planctomycetota bacterium]|nr:MAG: 50S ribosomal protein L23 [Planctomycetota bacterium]